MRDLLDVLEDDFHGLALVQVYVVGDEFTLSIGSVTAVTARPGLVRIDLALDGAVGLGHRLKQGHVELSSIVQALLAYLADDAGHVHADLLDLLLAVGFVHGGAAGLGDILVVLGRVLGDVRAELLLVEVNGGAIFVVQNMRKRMVEEDTRNKQLETLKYKL